MTELRKVLRWVGAVAMLQATVIFLVTILFERRLSSVATNLRNSLYENNVAVEQVDKVNQAFSSISNDLGWLFLGGMIFVSSSYALLAAIIKKSWPKPNGADG